MTAPRRIVAGETYLVTRRCTQRQSFLLPCEAVEQVFTYCLGEAAQRFDVTLHAWVAMSNHAHLVVRDNKGNLPEFLAHFHKLVAKALNAHWGRRENFWSTDQVSVVRLVDADDRLRKLVYVLANPVAADLVDRAEQWIGASSLEQNISGKTRTVGRPSFFREEGPMPETVTLRTEKLDGFERLRGADWSKRIASEVKKAENVARAARVGPVVGRQRLLAGKPTDVPKDRKKSKKDIPRGEKLNPHIACEDTDRRIEALRSLRGFRAAHRRALALWHDGDRTALFPAGTYRMRTFAHCRVSRAKL